MKEFFTKISMESEGVIIFDGYRNQNHLTVDADERNKRLSQLEEDTVALRDIFANLGELVNDQRETVKSIADFTEDIQIHVHEGSRLIKQAEVHQRKSRKKKLIVIVISGIIILILIVIIIHYLN